MSSPQVVLDGHSSSSTLSVLSSSLRCSEEYELIERELLSFQNSGCPIATNILSHLNIDRLSLSWSRFKDELNLPLKPRLGTRPKGNPVNRANRTSTKREAVHEVNFSAAFSYSGRERPYVSRVVDHLEDSLGENEVFYDRNHAGEMACASLDKALFKIYSENANFIIACLSQGYEESSWCQLEWNIIRSYINNPAQRAKVMLLRFDDHKITCLPPNEGFIDANQFEPKEIGNQILDQMQRLGLLNAVAMAHGMN